MSLVAVLGSAPGGFDQLASLRGVSAVYACNDAAAEYPGELAAFVTLHPEKLPAWLAKRTAPTLSVVAHEAAGGVTRVVDYRFPGMNASGSSGLFAAKVALNDNPGAGVVLCGVPMTPEPTGYAGSTFHREVDAFTGAWHLAKPYLKDRVRSMSGWTAMLLGMPTPEWLAQHYQQREAEICL